MNRLQDLETFVAVVEAAGFSAAATRLDIATSAVSRRVAALERRLGVQLFHRTTRRLRLSESGRAFYDRCVRILADLEEAESAVAQAHGELRGRIRVALPMAFGLRHLNQPIAEFSRLHPNVEFDLDLNDRRVDVVEEGVDVAIRIGRLEDSSLMARPLFDARTLVTAAPAYLSARGTPRKPEELKEHVSLAYSNVADPGRWVYRDRRGEKASVRVPVGLTANSGDFLCAAAVAGQGLLLQPTFIAHAAIKRGELKAILTEYDWPRTPAYAVYPPTRHLSYRVRAFIDFIAERFSGIPYWDRDCDLDPLPRAGTLNDHENTSGA